MPTKSFISYDVKHFKIPSQVIYLETKLRRRTYRVYIRHKDHYLDKEPHNNYLLMFEKFLILKVKKINFSSF